MKNNVAHDDPMSIKMNKQTSKKLQRRIEDEVDDRISKACLQTFMADKKILQPREDFFPWLTEELRKLKAEDEFKIVSK